VKRTLVCENWHVISELVYFVHRANMHLSEVDKLAVLALLVISRKPLVSCMEGLNSACARNLICYLSTVQLHLKSCKLTRRSCYKLFGRTAVPCERGRPRCCVLCWDYGMVAEDGTLMVLGGDNESSWTLLSCSGVAGLDSLELSVTLRRVYEAVREVLRQENHFPFPVLLVFAWLKTLGWNL